MSTLREMKSLWRRRPASASAMSLRAYARFCADEGSPVAIAWLKIKGMRRLSPEEQLERARQQDVKEAVLERRQEAEARNEARERANKIAAGLGRG